MMKKILAVLGITAVLFSVFGVFAFADSSDGTQQALNTIHTINSPSAINVLRLSQSGSYWATYGTPFVYTESIKEGAKPDYWVTSTPQGTYGETIVMSVHCIDDIVSTAFSTDGTSTSLNGFMSGMSAMQLYYENVYFGEHIPSIYFTTSEYYEFPPCAFTVRNYTQLDDGRVVVGQYQKEYDWIIVKNDDGTYSYYVDFPTFVAENRNGLYIAQMYIDMLFDEYGTNAPHFRDDYGFVFEHSAGFNGYSFSTKLVEQFGGTFEPNNDGFVGWIFEALESVFDYPLFYVYGVPVTPFGILSMAFGFGLFVWLIKLFAGG